jgi:hypothetical protein
MPKRAWCSGCRSYVMLTADDMCPYGHPRPSLRGIEEVGYGAPPSQPELGKAPEQPMQWESPSGYSTPTATVGGGYGASMHGSDATSSSYGSVAVATQPAYGGAYVGPNSNYGGSYATSEPVGGYGAPAAPAAATAMPSPAFEAPGASINPWQSDIDAVSLDPTLRTQLLMDADRIRNDIPWSMTWLGIIVWLFLLSPVGIYFLWQSPIPRSQEKWGIIGVFAAVVLFNLARFWLGFSHVMSHAPVVHP